MLQLSRSARAAALLVALLARPVLAHDDDPKILDRRPPWTGVGFRAAWAADPGETPFTESSAAAFGSSGLQLLSWLPVSEFGSQMVSANDCWGYVSGSGREYAIVGLSHGTAFVEVTAPGNAQIVAQVPGPPSLWRDVKVHADHAYAVSEGGSGIQVMDLSAIDSGLVTHVTDIVGDGDTDASHNVAIDSASATLYRCGGNQNGLRIYDLSTPSAPVFVGSWSSRYVHDAQVVTLDDGPFAGRTIAFCGTGLNGGSVDPGIDVLDVTDPTNVVELARVEDAAFVYSHQCWLSEDGTLLYVNDELDEDGVLPTTTYVIDVSDLTAPFVTTTFTNGNSAIGHNLYVKDGRIYEANYRSGLRVFDATNPLAPVEVAWYDTWPHDDSPSFNGLWSVYPFLPSGLVIGSDIERGLFVWQEGPPVLTFAYPGGAPDLFDPAGQSLLVRVLESSPGALVASSAALHVDWGAGWVDLPLADLGGGDFEAQLPAMPCGAHVRYYLSADSAAGTTWTEPAAQGGGVNEALAAPSLSVALADAVESPAGWTVGDPGDDATTGVWVHGDPVGTGPQPEDDHSPAGTQCWFTGQAQPGDPVGTADVDDGVTTLVSPPLDVTGLVDPHVAYWRWYSNDVGGAKLEDALVVSISDDGGASWQTVETVGTNGIDVHGGWIRHAFRVADFVPVGPGPAQVRLRFVAGDLNSGSLIEAAIDDLEVFGTTCTDCDTDLLADAQELLADPALDLDADGGLDACQSLRGDGAALSLAAGGVQGLALDAGAGNAGEVYFLFGNYSGTAPGIDLGGFVLPLNYDLYLEWTLLLPNLPPLTTSLGFLDGSGQGASAFTLQAGSDPALAGVVLHHAYALFSQPDLEPFFASNAWPLELLP